MNVNHLTPVSEVEEDMQNKNHKTRHPEFLLKACKLASKQTSPSLEPVKEIIRTKKAEERMRIGYFYYCDGCDEPIHSPVDGVIVHGNIYVADPTTRGGLIGNNFPDVKPGDKIEVTDVKETVFCRSCFTEAVFGNSQRNSVKFTNQLTNVDEYFIKELQKMGEQDISPQSF